MKANIHPKYFDSAEIRCSCGNTFMAGSIKEKLSTELCSACHPFYTGKIKLIDTAGRVDKFAEKMKKVATLREAAKRQSEQSKKKPEIYVEKEVSEEVIKRAMGAPAQKKKGKWGEPLGNSPAEEVLRTQKAISKKPVVKKKAPVKRDNAKKASAKKVVVKKAVNKKAQVKKTPAGKTTKKKS